MQIEGTKLIFIMNISVLDFFKLDSRMPQIAQILVSTFKFFQGSMPPDPHRNFLFFFPWAIPGSAVNKRKKRKKFAWKQMILNDLYESWKNVSAILFWMRGTFPPPLHST